MRQSPLVLVLAGLVTATAILAAPGKGAGAASPPSTGAPLDLKALDVCALVPGEQVASAVGARLVGTVPFRAENGRMSRCRYTAKPAAAKADEQAVYTVWVLPANAFGDMREGEEKPITDVSGLGDGAFLAFHRDEGRHWLTVLILGRATVQVTGTNANQVRKLSALAVARVRPGPATSR